MNTAARAIAESHAMQGRLSHILQGQRQLGLISLIAAVLVSAFAVVYERTAYRETLSEYQGLQVTHHELALRTKQLELEQSAWANPVRIQALAERALDMRLPDYQHSIMVKL